MHQSISVKGICIRKLVFFDHSAHIMRVHFNNNNNKMNNNRNNNGYEKQKQLKLVDSQ